jgi:BirA family biotin operon repressor/biotin-[acetyl-CoA-carboxylase] ligase
LELISKLQELGDSKQRTVIHLETVDSTSTELERLLKKDAEPGTLVTAGNQTMGRGRKGRTWHSPPKGNLYLSTLVSVGETGSVRLNLLPLAAGVAALDAMKDVFPLDLKLKWPNDVLLGGLKTAGILCEVPDPKKQPLLAIVGLGVNIATSTFPDELHDLATNLVHSDTDLKDAALSIAARFVTYLEEWMARIDEGEGTNLIDGWRKRDEPFGRKVRVGELEGMTRDLNDNGRLIIKKENGDLETVAGGIVEYI